MARSLLKEPKYCFFDSCLVKGNPGIIIENTIAVSLLKMVYGASDAEGIPWNLHYLRTKDGAEIDCCVVKESTPQSLIEVKHADSKLSSFLIRSSQQLNIPGIQVVKELNRGQKVDNVTIRKASGFLKELSY